MGRDRRGPGRGASRFAAGAESLSSTRAPATPDSRHSHFHVCVIDGVFEPDPQDGVRFFADEKLDAQDAEVV
ncbi:MAG: hypothetical protein LJE70_01300 [Chromatiaceae bacterium]|nr:hypothetical protein [Chromatiaceae bacterium]